MVRRFDLCAFVYARVMQKAYGLPVGVSNAIGVAIARAIAILKNSRHRNPGKQASKRKPYRPVPSPVTRQELTGCYKIDNFYVVYEPPIVTVYLSQPTPESQPIASSTVAEGEKYSMRFDITNPVYIRARNLISEVEFHSPPKKVFEIYRKVRDEFGL